PRRSPCPISEGGRTLGEAGVEGPQACFVYWGDVLYTKKLYDQAAQKYQAAIDADKNEPYPLAYNGLGLTLEAQGQVDEALAQYEKAAEIWEKQQSKDLNLSLCNWGDVLYTKKLHDQAEQKYQASIDADRDEPYARAYNCLGLALAAQERYDEAFAQYQKAAE